MPFGCCLHPLRRTAAAERALSSEFDPAFQLIVAFCSTSGTEFGLSEAWHT
jgi:hypothetical protein